MSTHPPLGLRPRVDPPTARSEWPDFVETWVPFLLVHEVLFAIRKRFRQGTRPRRKICRPTISPQRCRSRGGNSECGTPRPVQFLGERANGAETRNLVPWGVELERETNMLTDNDTEKQRGNNPLDSFEAFWGSSQGFLKMFN